MAGSGREDRVVGFIDPSERRFGSGAAIVPLRGLCRCVPHAARYLVYWDSSIEDQKVDQPSGRVEYLAGVGVLVPARDAIHHAEGLIR